MPKRESSSPLCKSKVLKFTRVNNSAEVDKIISNRLVNNKIEKAKRVGQKNTRRKL